MPESATETAKRQMLTMRVTQEMKDRLGDIAERSGRSLSQEIEMRLDRTFAQDSALGGVEQARVVVAITQIMEVVSEEYGVSWLDRVDAWDTATNAIRFLLAVLEPATDEHIYPADLAETPEIAAALREYEDQRSLYDSDQHRAVENITRLIMKQQASGLDNQEQLDLAEFTALSKQPKPEPKLGESDLEIWREQQRFLDVQERARRRAIGITQPFLRASKFV